jgi:hypothetical protein
MKLHTRLAVALLAGAPAAALAQSPQVAATVSYTLHWTNSVTGDQTPLSPGQGARLTLSALMTPGVGTVVAVAPGVLPSGNTLATLRGIQSMFLDLVGTGSAEGNWSNLHVDEMWDLLGPFHGTSTAGGARLINIQAGQFPTSWILVMAFNPVVFWSGTWTPASYEVNLTTFTVANATANPSAFASNVLARDGVSTLITVGTAANDFGSAQIPIIPAPSALALLAFGLLMGGRRGRYTTGFNSLGPSVCTVNTPSDRPSR